MELADRTLKHSIDHEHIAGEDLVAIRNYSNTLAHALDDVHRQGWIQGDFKPLNTGAVGMTWKLLDFDCSCQVDEPFGNKIPSSCYCPPEMANVLLGAMDDQGKVSGAKLVKYKASVAYDLWSFGVVLYHLCFGMPLWLSNTNDDVRIDDLRILALESDLSQLRSVLDKATEERQTAFNADELKTAIALLRKLLEPDAEKRLAHFAGAESCMASVLAEPFFQAEAYDKNLSPITGIPNKAAYDLLLKKAPEGRLRCVYSIDMANLKVLNEWPGLSHDKADEVLTWYAKKLEKEASQIEDHALVQAAGAYHMHGDEFCVVACAAQDVDEAAFTAQAHATLLKMAAIQYRQPGYYPETYLRIGALCASDADYEKADILQDGVGKQLKLDYPDRSKICPLAGRRNFLFESVDIDSTAQQPEAADTLRAELKAAREEAKEAKAHGETEMARREAKSREEAETARGETETARGVAEAAEGNKWDKPPHGCCARCSEYSRQWATARGWNTTCASTLACACTQRALHALQRTVIVAPGMWERGTREGQGIKGVCTVRVL